MKDTKKILTYGFTIFAMFFGSGNLVFPLAIGSIAQNSWIYGFLGLFLTGIILPFMGLFVIKLYNGDYEAFFNEAGSFAKYVIPFFTISLLGSFGVVPRCITVAHGGVSYINSDIKLWFFAIVFSVISYFFSLKQNIMINIIGKILSPILLSFLLLLIFFGIYFETEFIYNPDASNAFYIGFFKGYQTMDLFAAFFFSSLIFLQIQKSEKNSNEKSVFYLAIKSSVLGSILLSIVYMGFVFLGGKFSKILDNSEAYHFLPIISEALLGENASLFLAICMILSCITTAVALNGIYARFLLKLFSSDEKYFSYMLFVTTFISFIVSLLDFSIISAFLAPLLEISYPGLIVLTILSIITRKFKILKMTSFWIITIIAGSKFLI